MASKLKKLFGRQLVAITLVLSIVGVSYMPATAPRAQAIFGIGDIVFTMNEIVRAVVDGVAMSLAQKMIDDIVNSTIRWANTGFDGNPAYVTDPEQYFTDIASGVIGEAINDSKLGFLCSPFQAQIKLSLRQIYVPPENEFQCTLEDIGVNYDNFVDNFQEGGWEAWLKITQEDQNNPYGAFVTAKIDTDQRLNDLLGLKRLEYNINQGFRSFGSCLKVNPEPPANVREIYENFGINALEVQEYIEDTGWDPNKDAGDCIKDGPIKTAGSTIKSQLDNVLPSGLEKLISVQHIEGLIGAFASGLLQRFVFSEGGLFGDNSAEASTREIIDIDNDRIPDGYDIDDDDDLDICHHGLRDRSQNPSNTNCIGSKNMTNSPYFIPICESVATTIRSIENYKEFIDANEFNRAYANTWMNKTTVVSGAVDGLINTISRYEIMAYDPALFTLGGYVDYLGDRIESLAKDGDLRGSFFLDSQELNLMRKVTNDVLAYLENFSDAIGSCNNPDTDAIGSIPPVTVSTTTPTTDDDDEPTGPTLSCVPSTQSAIIGQTIIWYVQSSYPDDTTYTWSGTEINTQDTDSPQALFIAYEEEGVKEAFITATPDDEDEDPVVEECESTVTVSEDDGEEDGPEVQ